MCTNDLLNNEKTTFMFLFYFGMRQRNDASLVGQCANSATMCAREQYQLYY